MPDDPIANARPSDAYVRKIDPDWIEPIGEACLRFDIDTPERVVPFLANCAHESQSFTRLVESLHYSGQRLLAVFPKYFTPEEAVEFAYDDVRIGERVYGGRMGNGSEGTGDGYLYRGRGLLQITGRGMYAKCGRALGADLEGMPALLEQPSFAALSAAWVWAEEKHCNTLADEGRWQSIVLRLNGGLNGMADRMAWLDKLRA
jgi:putative chitinase